MAPPVLLWFRDDLRLSDQAALSAAVSTKRPVVPVYVLDEDAARPWTPGGASRWWLHHSLASLTADLRKRGSALLLRRGDAAHHLYAVAQAVGADAVHAGDAPEPWARAQETRVVESLNRAGIALHRHRTTALFGPDAIHTRAGGPFRLYAPFARACAALGPPPLPRRASARLPAPDHLPPSDELDGWGLAPRTPDWSRGLRDTWAPGEQAARIRLSRFTLRALARYLAERDKPGIDGTSRLSPHLHFGEISPATVWHAANGHPGGAKFLAELLWREFARHLLWHTPSLPATPMRPAFASMRWRRDKAGLRAWQRGRTGVPIVDAVMRQLWRISWMHNRVRMIVASLLVKHLLVDWRDGAAWFWDTLVDADLANNSLNWQWVAGSGSESQPFGRVFNPLLQATKFDRDGTYIRTWVPETGADRKPIVDLAEGRERALDAYAQITTR